MLRHEDCVTRRCSPPQDGVAVSASATDKRTPRRLVGDALKDVRQQVALSLITEFENFSVFKPGEYNLAALDTMLDQVVAWSTALAPLRVVSVTA